MAKAPAGGKERRDAGNDESAEGEASDGDKEDTSRKGREAGTKEDLPDADEKQMPKPVQAVGVVQDVIYYVIAVMLLAVAVVAVVRTVNDLFTQEDELAKRLTDVVNSVLFVIIVMEILRTIVAHFRDVALQLKPFLIIGVISAVRHILTVGAQLSLEQDKGGDAVVHRTEVELAVNAAVVVALVVALVLVRRTE